MIKVFFLCFDKTLYRDCQVHEYAERLVATLPDPLKVNLMKSFGYYIIYLQQSITFYLIH